MRPMQFWMKSSPNPKQPEYFSMPKMVCTLAAEVEGLIAETMPQLSGIARICIAFEGKVRMKGNERLLLPNLFPEKTDVRAFTSSPFFVLPKRAKRWFPFSERARLMLRSFFGYIFYSADQHGRMIAYCFLKRNYLRKYRFMQTRDVIINPYFVSPEFRGKGYGEIILQMSTKDRQAEWHAAWAVVKADNLPSIAALRRTGFLQVGYSMKNGWSHHLTKTPTPLIVFRKDREALAEGNTDDL